MVYESQYLTRGYTNHETNSLEKINSNVSVYYSGDLARYAPNGDLVYIGRKDSQVKINGIRIELEDIEVAIKKNDTSKLQNLLLVTRELKNTDPIQADHQ